MPPSDTLAEALERRSIALPPEKIKLLDYYCKLLWDWNTKINLTRHTDYEKFVQRDVVDSMTIANFLVKDEKILDVGTGGGVPGIILAILRPDVQVELCDSTGKKAKAVQEIVEALRLKIPVIHAKAEELLKTRKYNTLVVRAVAKMPQLLRILAPHWNAFERILMLKGANWVAERGESRHFGLMKNISLRKIAANPIEGTEDESVLLQLSKKSCNSVKKP